ncbi:HRDC domain-containing protein [Paenibacillus lignilyticus]|uniref:HRDC domain-containing protein n=1 Tax=Paenibacillus lignilyticus TaxID=1172615 RepID=A0ABS5C7S2_9BACL|nr:HRDC domain-containing protein [Paenibacillus lignilyticus]MBP3962048.1 HRDC domain-containing protein [Paenibacillus lignilyticus]
MQVVFLNTFEKVGQDSRAEQAQLSICEQNGVWSVIWTESYVNGLDEQQAVWFEGSSWEEMMTAFRHGIAVQMGEGYSPLIDGMLEERRGHDGLGSLYSMIQCYGEMNTDPVLFEALREWRRSKAVEGKKSAYLIASNRMLWMLSSFVPHQPEELMQIPGWGETKQAAYAEEVLAITRNFQRERSFPLDWVSTAIDPKVYIKWVYKQKENKYKSQMDRQQEKQKLLRGIAEGNSLEGLIAQTDLPRRDLMERIEKLETEGYDMEPLIERELESMPESEQQLVWDAYIAVGDRYLKPVLQRVYGEEAVQGKGKSIDLIYDRLRLIRLRYRRMKINQVS